jgi:hypothetical protein
LGSIFGTESDGKWGVRASIPIEWPIFSFIATHLQLHLALKNQLSDVRDCRSAGQPAPWQIAVIERLHQTRHNAVATNWISAGKAKAASLEMVPRLACATAGNVQAAARRNRARPARVKSRR